MIGVCAFAAETVPLDIASLKISNVKAERVAWKGRSAIRVDDANPDARDGSRLAVVPRIVFQDGILELDLAGDTGLGAAPTARALPASRFVSAPVSAVRVLLPAA